MRRIKPQLTPILLALCALSARADEQAYAIEKTEGVDAVEFSSQARIESFSGHGADLSGWFALDPEALGPIRGELRFELANLDTGIALRNKHMHENILHTERFPVATLVPIESDQGQLGAEDSSFRMRAELTLHGVTRPVEIEVRARREDGAIAFSAAFEVALADFEIPRPRMLILKVAERVQIEVHAIARPASPPERSN